ncbi:MAG: Uma2 family endonuclease [Nostoc sp.]|uniref:Uma2 family endonuclease n=1 Tax=Nostoc sp. TaxID=1180 RepID=UPI002FF5BD50
MTAITVNLNPIIQLTDNQFYQLCRENPEVKFERNAEGKLLIMPATGKETGNNNFEISVEFGIWNRQTQLGICFDSSTCFKLPNGAKRSPDVGWIRKERWNALTPEEQEKFPPIAPGRPHHVNKQPIFLIELKLMSLGLTYCEKIRRLFWGLKNNQTRNPYFFVGS